MQAEEKAWELLMARDPREVCEQAEADYSPDSGRYSLRVFGHSVLVAPRTRTMDGTGAEARLTLTETAFFSRLPILYYLASARKIPLAGSLVKPSELKGGQIYFRGSHVLPLDQMAARFARDADAFIRQAARFGGLRRGLGDAGVEMRPFPRLPVTLAFWREDDEFSSRGALFFDATCELQVPPDILWSIAMLSIKVMLLPNQA